MAAHRVPRDGPDGVGGELGLDERRQLLGHVRPHLEVGVVGGLRGVDVEARPLAEVVAVHVGDAVPARRSVGGDDHDPAGRGGLEGHRGLLDEVVVGAGQPREPVEHGHLGDPRRGREEHAEGHFRPGGARGVPELLQGASEHAVLLLERETALGRPHQPALLARRRPPRPVSPPPRPEATRSKPSLPRSPGGGPGAPLAPAPSGRGRAPWPRSGAPPRPPRSRTRARARAPQRSTEHPSAAGLRRRKWRTSSSPGRPTLPPPRRTVGNTRGPGGGGAPPAAAGCPGCPGPQPPPPGGAQTSACRRCRGRRARGRRGGASDPKGPSGAATRTGRR